jgi:hypothetical protein
MNDFSIEAPTNVVTITITTVTVYINSMLFDYICRHKANAITPLTIPEYQQTFSYFPFSGNCFFDTL